MKNFLEKRTQKRTCRRNKDTWISAIKPFLVDLLVLFGAPVNWSRINLHLFRTKFDHTLSNSVALCSNFLETNQIFEDNVFSRRREKANKIFFLFPIFFASDRGWENSRFTDQNGALPLVVKVMILQLILKS